MPCYDPRQYEDSNSGLREKVDKLTDLLCKAGKAYVLQAPAPPDVVEWWVQHEKIDRDRGAPWF